LNISQQQAAAVVAGWPPYTVNMVFAVETTNIWKSTDGGNTFPNRQNLTSSEIHWTAIACKMGRFSAKNLFLLWWTAVNLRSTGRGESNGT
jgi:hypothetical protein